MAKLNVVTGATGHLGNVLVRQLLAQGQRVRAVVQPGDDLTPLAGLAVEVAHADVTDAAAVSEAVRDADVVFHLAGLVSITLGQHERLWQVNVGGTRNVVAACRERSVGRLVHVSSVHALVEPRGGQLNENAGFATTGEDYTRTKAEASRFVAAAAHDGLDAVQVLPTGVLGPWDFRLSEMGQFVARVGRHGMPVAISGGYDWVDVRDVADGLLLAAEKGRRGEAYVLNGEWMSVSNLATSVAQAAGLHPPWLTVPLALVWPFAWVARAWELLTHRRALLTPYALRQLSADYRVDDSKARRELGYTSRPVAVAIADAWRFLASDPASPIHRAVVVQPGRATISGIHGAATPTSTGARR